jgi:ferredoxin
MQSLPIYKPSGELSRPIREQPRGFDLLRLPGLRRFIRWPYARLVFQIPLLVLALFAIYDGFTGRQLAPRNVATTSVWLHYRGLVIIALAIVGNAFCAACPLMLTRGPSKGLRRLIGRDWRWPSALRNKYFAIVLLVLFFFSLEAFDLWASPWLTAWLIVGYFVGALLIDTFFPAGTFCRYVCPLGQFNFTYATASPTQITAVDHDVCRKCEHKPCLHGRESYAAPPSHTPKAAFIPLSEVKNSNGQGHFPGCETGLFVPTITSNMDCTYCFNCVRACPYDNVALTVRAPGREWLNDPWRRRGKMAVILMGILLAFWGLLNAVAMIAPFYDAAAWLGATLQTQSKALVIAAMFALVTVGGVAITTALGLLADRLGGVRSSPREALLRWGYLTLPLGFGFWGAHYLFHFLTGALSIVPVFEHFFWLRGAEITPNWRLAQVVPTRWLFPIGAGLVSLYTLLAAYTAMRIALRDFGRQGALAMWPMLIFILGFGALSVWILAQPMEMRGTIFGP